MSELVSKDQLQAAMQVRSLLAAKREVEDLIRIGAYQKGTDHTADLAIATEPHLLTFLRQRRDETTDFQSTVQVLQAIAQGVVTE